MATLNPDGLVSAQPQWCNPDYIPMVVAGSWGDHYTLWLKVGRKPEPPPIVALIVYPVACILAAVICWPADVAYDLRIRWRGLRLRRAHDNNRGRNRT